MSNIGRRAFLKTGVAFIGFVAAGQMFGRLMPQGWLEDFAGYCAPSSETAVAHYIGAYKEFWEWDIGRQAWLVYRVSKIDDLDFYAADLITPECADDPELMAMIYKGMDMAFQRAAERYYLNRANVITDWEEEEVLV